jgi:hypothetical protein
MSDHGQHGESLTETAAGRLDRSGRRRRLKIAASQPWAAAIVTAWDRISALAQAP